ncbi:hypothetical protein Tco_1082388 [Tanacetum coccineum]|uniref:Uncharacterized protein n=1 Tax=Tanacetum coccineum TaxID=301880 RepID=A0ABQ5I0A8_9ASTR
MATPSNWQTPNQSNWLSPSNWQTPNPSYLGTPNSQPPIPSPHGTSNLQNPMTSYYSPNLPPPSQDAGILDPVYMPINVGGVHWVTGAIDLADSIFKRKNRDIGIVPERSFRVTFRSPIIFGEQDFTIPPTS